VRIAVISRVFSRSGGGAESYSVALVQQMASENEVHVFAQESNQPVAQVHYHPVFCLSRKPRWINQLIFSTASWWHTRRGFDIVHSHENTWQGQIQTIHVRPLRHNLLHGKRGFRLALSWLKIALSPRLLTYLWLEGARFKCQPSRRIVATSEALRLECEQAYPAWRGQISVITPGAHPVQMTMTRDEARTRLDLQPTVPLLLFVANDYARKGLDTLLLALTELSPDVHLAVVGHTTQIPRYRLQVQQLGLLDRVHFLGTLDNLLPAYHAADCLAHPTLEDSFAMVVLEAMAHELPVVVSGPAHCGISQGLQDGREALLLPDPLDAHGLAQRLRSVLEQPELSRRLRQHALAYAQAHTWESAALQYLALYQGAIDSPNT
jgi:UDP-glucose:(heptosyl)LPS alpha-1,3-glucosyltransferase